MEKEESDLIKNKILELLDKGPLTFKEIHEHFKEYPRTTVSNWMLSIRTLELARLNTSRIKGNDNKYYRIGEKSFTQAIQDRMEENNNKRKLAYHRKKQESQANPHGRVYRMEDFKHKSKGNKTQISSWSGYGNYYDI